MAERKKLRDFWGWMRGWAVPKWHKSTVPQGSRRQDSTIFTNCQSLYEGYFIRIGRLKGSLGGVCVEILHPPRPSRGKQKSRPPEDGGRRNRGFRMTEKRCQFRNWYEGSGGRMENPRTHPPTARVGHPAYSYRVI